MTPLDIFTPEAYELVKDDPQLMLLAIQEFFAKQAKLSLEQEELDEREALEYSTQVLRTLLREKGAKRSKRSHAYVITDKPFMPKTDQELQELSEKHKLARENVTPDNLKDYMCAFVPVALGCLEQCFQLSLELRPFLVPDKYFDGVYTAKPDCDWQQCYYCHQPAESVDHVLPQALAAKSDKVKNWPKEVLQLVPACKSCNSTAQHKVFISLEAKRAWIVEQRVATLKKKLRRRK